MKVMVMSRVKFNIFLITVICYITILFCCLLRNAIAAFPGEESQVDHAAGCTVRITDESGNLVTMTARKVSKGDEIITSTGQYYRVTFVGGDKAKAKLLGQDKDYLTWAGYFKNSQTVAVTAINWGNRSVGVYHTHTDESYIPTDGKSSIPFNGGIYEVGSEFVEALRDRGVQVKYYKTPHDPHDANAYARSRRTAMGLLKHNPIALFDVHRDGVDDPEFFKEEINGDDIAQLRIVVGRQNPKVSANMDFARRLMAYANKKHPGLVKEIFKAQGNYNQDLLSTSILLEAGTYTNSREMAESGMRLLAEAVPVVLGVDNPGGITGKGASKTGWKVALLLTLVTLGAGAVFAFINFGWQGTIDRVKNLVQRLVDSDFWARVGRAGTRGKEYIQGPLAGNFLSVWEKLRQTIKRRNKI